MRPTSPRICTFLVVPLLLLYCDSLRGQIVGLSTADRQDPGVETTAPGEPSAADWHTYNHDAAGWRFNPAEKSLGPANVARLVEKWRFPAQDSRDTIGVVHATPTVVAGEVYFGTATFPAFYKLSPAGKLRWVYRNPMRQPGGLRCDILRIVLRPLRHSSSVV